MNKSTTNIIAAIAAVMAVTGTALTLHADEYWDQRTSLFELLPIRDGDIVFLGNSITDGGEFTELFDMPNIKNRGIRGDVITGVEKRLGQVTSGHPAKIFLLIGINDVSHGHSATELARRYERLVKRIRSESPGTELYLQSVMPVNNAPHRYKNLIGKEQVIKDLNIKIKEIAEANSAQYVDLWPALANKDGELPMAYTNDGLHLNGRGYRVWSDAIRSLVSSSLPNQSARSSE